MQDFRDYQASCAYCNRPADGECVSGCETTRLNQNIDIAEAQWFNQWRERTKEWVAHHAVKHVTQTFEQMKETRIANHAAELHLIPLYTAYEQYRGAPPFHPQHIAQIRQQIHSAEFDLRRNIDADWRSCVARYPEVLKYYFSQINVTLPTDVDHPTTIMPSFPAMLPPPSPTMSSKLRSAVGPTSPKKNRRSINVAKDDGNLVLDVITKMLQDQVLSVPSQKLKSGRRTPAFDMPLKSAGKKRVPSEFTLSGGKSVPRAPTAPLPPSSQGPWRPPPQY